MANCDDLFTQLDRIATALEKQNAIVAGEPAEELDGEGQPVYDYSQSGLVPSLVDALHIDRLIYADKNIAEVLFEGLVGRKLGGLPLPFEGKGLADIADEQLQELHNRFRQFDLSFPGGLEKNITETLETLLRTDKITDLEFITPNLVTILNQVFKLEDDNPLSILVGELYAWLIGEPAPELPEYNTIAELLLLIARARLEAETSPAGLTTAINTLTTSLAGDLETIGDNITAQTVVIETRSGAEVVAQTTNFNNLIAGLSSLASRLSPDDASNLYAVIGALDLVANCSPDVNLSFMPNISVNCGGTGGGTEPPSQPGTEGGTPPPGWEPPPTPVYDRKCRIANAIHDNYVEWITLMEAYHVDTYTSALLIPLITLLGALAGEITTPVPIVDGVIGAVVGFLSGVAIAIVEGGFDLSNLIPIMNNKKEDLVCALYNSTDVESGRTAYIQVLLDNGADITDVGLLGAAMVVDALNHLYFMKDQRVEAALDGYTGTVDCGVCGGEEGCEDIVYDFLTLGTLGFELESRLNPSDLDNFGTRSVSLSPDGGLRMQSSAASGWRSCYAGDPAGFTPIAILPGAKVSWTARNNVSVTTSMQLVIKTDVGYLYCYGTHGTGTFTHEKDLTANAGETILDWQFYINSNGGNVSVDWHKAEFLCPEE